MQIILYRRDGTTAGIAHVDREDVRWLNTWAWRLNAGGYVYRGERRGGVYHTIYLHREIMGLEAGDPREVDHEDGDPLNNRRSNLLVVDTRSEQMQNHGVRPHSSRFRGVTWDKRRGRWMARAKLRGRFVFLGYFDSEEAAAKVAADWRVANMPNTNEDRAA